MTSSRLSAILTICLCIPAAAAVAQGRDDNPKPSAAPRTDVQRPGTLSDKLGETGGVIRPTDNVDPGMHKAAPVEHPNSTPVIPPPGTEGRPGAVPK